MASGATPASAIPYPTSTDTVNVQGDLQALATKVDQRVIVPVASPGDRSTKIPTPLDGVISYRTDTHQYERWNAGLSAWRPLTEPLWLARSSFQSASDTVLSTSVADLPAFAFTVPLLLANRHIRVEFTVGLKTDSAGTAYGFVLVFAGVQRRFIAQLPIAGTAAHFTWAYTFETTGQLTNASGGVPAAGRFAGSGTTSLVTTGIDGPATLTVTDLGPV